MALIATDIVEDIHFWNIFTSGNSFNNLFEQMIIRHILIHHLS